MGSCCSFLVASRWFLLILGSIWLVVVNLWWHVGSSLHPHNVTVNTFGAMLLIALPTNRDDVFVTTQSTDGFFFIFTIMSWGGAWVIYHGPNMWRHMDHKADIALAC